MIVVDTNVISYALISGDKTPLALQVEARDANWRVPALWRHEFLNVLATSTRLGVLDADQAEGIWQQAVMLLSPAEDAVDMRAALKLAIDLDISAYDAQYIYLAKSLGVPCVTEDRKLQRACPDVAISMAAFC